MSNTNNNDPFFNKNSYISFDATSLRDLIVDRLNQGQVFTDQNYTGSNMSAFLDIISFSFSTLLYYLNKTASESMFSEAQIYENMNRIVKLLNYKPRGNVTQTLSYELSATSDLPSGSYIIPRYSYMRVGNDFYSFNKDIFFTKNTDNSVAMIQNTIGDLFLYQGQYQEYPIQTAKGVSNEVIYLNINNATVDHFNIDVYVKSIDTGVWTEWKPTENLFLNKSQDKVFEIRYNPNKNYEIKFGDDINGKQIKTGDQILIYYLGINPEATQVGIGSLSNLPIVFYNSLNYLNIQNDTLYQKDSLLNTTSVNYIQLNNQYPSNPYLSEESVEDIRKNAPQFLTPRTRLVTYNDFETYLKANYGSMFSAVKVLNNDEYMRQHIKYLYDIGIKEPQFDGRVLYNQIKFATSCNFNNVYLYIVPSNRSQKYITGAQKELVLQDLESIKVLTSEIVTVDPVYMYFDFYIKTEGVTPSVNDLRLNNLVIYKDVNSRKSAAGILSEAISIIKNTFDKSNTSLGSIINLSQLTTSILAIEGVTDIKTYRSDTQTYIDGISMLVWNETYPKLDIQVYGENVQLKPFQYPVFNNIDNLISRIRVIEPSGIIQITDF
jgi:hypothetical protein